MDSKVGLGDIRGLLVDSDKRPVLRLLPQMDEVSRGYALSHLGDAEAIAKQVWVLNATDWIRGHYEISWRLCKDLDLSGFDRALHEFAMKIAEDLFNFHEKKGWKVSKESWELLKVKRRWIGGEVSDEEFKKERVAYRSASWVAYWAVDLIAYWAADMDADLAANLAISWAAYYGPSYYGPSWVGEEKRQVGLLGDMLEDAVGIERGVEEKSLESKVLTGGL